MLTGYGTGLLLTLIGGWGVYKGESEMHPLFLATGIGSVCMAFLADKEPYGFEEQAWNIAPTVLPDSEGNMTAGLGLTLTGF